jgi:hypothetical protein
MYVSEYGLTTPRDRAHWRSHPTLQRSARPSARCWHSRTPGVPGYHRSRGNIPLPCSRKLGIMASRHAWSMMASRSPASCRESTPPSCPILARVTSVSDLPKNS